MRIKAIFGLIRMHSVEAECETLSQYQYLAFSQAGIENFRLPSGF